MGYFNRHFNKQLERKGFRIVKGTKFETYTDENDKEVRYKVEIKAVFIGRSQARPQDYKSALSGRM
jgi:hypothetical protein